MNHFTDLPMRKPWNRPDLPVYSIASKGIKDNMNICTYAIAVSMQPKRYAIAIYKGTLTLENVQTYPHLVLQLLCKDQYRLTVALGKKTGKKTDKISGLKRKISLYREFLCLNEAAAWIHCSVIEWIDAGDHMLAICDVNTFKNQRNDELLTTGYLREKKLIRA